MLPRRLLEEDPEVVRRSLAARRNDFDLDGLLQMLAERKRLLAELEQLQARRNSGSKEVGALFKSGKHEEGEALRRELASLGDRVADLQAQSSALEGEVDARMLLIPNLLSPDVPDGADSSQNRVVRSWG